MLISLAHARRVLHWRRCNAHRPAGIHAVASAVLGEYTEAPGKNGSIWFRLQHLTPRVALPYNRPRICSKRLGLCSASISPAICATYASQSVPWTGWSALNGYCATRHAANQGRGRTAWLARVRSRGMWDGGLRVEGCGLRVEGSGVRVLGYGVWVVGFLVVGFRVYGLGIRV